jgi:putative Mg2+ transporter-C (MgtC) family protein
MAIELTWQAAALRLALTVAAGAVIGINRGERGHAAGLRTTILVAVAACVAMLQVNVLLPLEGKSASSYVTMDLMRLPLGILSGMGFIGAGAILRRDGGVVGVTTAATLWLMTVIGLCFGGGQLALGASATGIGVVVLWAMKWVDDRLPRDQHATLVVVSTTREGVEDRVRAALARAQLGTSYASGCYAAGRVEVRYLVRWRGAGVQREPSELLAEISADPRIESVRWTSEGSELPGRG